LLEIKIFLQHCLLRLSVFPCRKKIVASFWQSGIRERAVISINKVRRDAMHNDIFFCRRFSVCANTHTLGTLRWSARCSVRAWDFRCPPAAPVPSLNSKYSPRTRRRRWRTRFCCRAGSRSSYTREPDCSSPFCRADKALDTSPRL